MRNASRQRSGSASQKARKVAARAQGVPPSRLQVYAAGQILAVIRQDGMKAGQHLGEVVLAERLGVSRTSVRGALRILGAQDIVDARPHRGYVLRQDGSELEAGTELPPSSDEKLYMQIARDYVVGSLPESTTETDLMRRYDASRHLVLAALAVLTEEGIIHRGKGREWRFREILKSSRARQESYELRLMVEPAALLLPTFQIDKAQLDETRKQQVKLLTSAESGVSHRVVFQTDASFHEMLAKLSGNAFVLSTIRQQNRLRRLLEYQSYLDAKRVKEWCLEHISVIEALLDENQHLAARYLTKHLENARLAPADTSRKGRKGGLRPRDTFVFPLTS
jgi:DNA-binding GntR family transcriptional regulator